VHNDVTKHVLELKLTQFFAVTKPGCANHERVNCRMKKGTQVVHVTVTLCEISLIGPKKCDGDLSLLLDLKDGMSHFSGSIVSLKCDNDSVEANLCDSL
jgi:hypothetical protein